MGLRAQHELGGQLVAYIESQVLLLCARRASQRRRVTVQRVAPRDDQVAPGSIERWSERGRVIRAFDSKLGGAVRVALLDEAPTAPELDSDRLHGGLIRRLLGGLA